MKNRFEEIFKEITQIPRCSGQEQKITDYLIDFAKKNQLSYTLEPKSGNVIIRKPASFGFEEAPTVILQGHLDMVCEKNSDVTHDFSSDPLELIEEEGKLRANGTTLGADNGIAVAYALAVLEDSSLIHPAIEALFTTEEETTMKGAAQLDPTNLQGTLLLNLDSEDEGIFFVSSAGGVDLKIISHYEGEALSEDWQRAQISLTGLTGGHSGGDIHLSKGNANLLLGQTLDALRACMPFELLQIQGGDKVNAIPREARCLIAFKASERSLLEQTLQDLQAQFASELEEQEKPRLALTSSSDRTALALDPISKDRVIDLLRMLPNGVDKMSRNIEGLVLSSSNLGVLATQDQKVIFHISVRSSIKSLRDSLCQKISLITRAVGADLLTQDDYPEWQYAPHSPIREHCVKVYQEMYQKEPALKAIHAGLECGYLAQRLKNNPIDIISFGPTIRDVHSPREYLDIESARRVYQYLVRLLASLQ